jgi:hypothetical protein
VPKCCLKHHVVDRGLNLSLMRCRCCCRRHLTRIACGPPACDQSAHGRSHMAACLPPMEVALALHARCCFGHRHLLLGPACMAVCEPRVHVRAIMLRTTPVTPGPPRRAFSSCPLPPPAHNGHHGLSGVACARRSRVLVLLVSTTTRHAPPPAHDCCAWRVSEA